MSGSDPDNLCSRVRQGLNRVDWTNPPQVDLIIGSGFRHGDELRRIAEDHVAGINIAENVSNIGEYMQNADLADFKQLHLLDENSITRGRISGDRGESCDGLTHTGGCLVRASCSNSMYLPGTDLRI